MTTKVGGLCQLAKTALSKAWQKRQDSSVLAEIRNDTD
jgi:hypothetical protein